MFTMYDLWTRINFSPGKRLIASARVIKKADTSAIAGNNFLRAVATVTAGVGARFSNNYEVTICPVKYF